MVRRLIVDSLRFWVSEMHVDGFRFDLASVLSRDEDGRPLARPPILWDIDSDPVLAGTKLIAEAWDAAGLYQVGSFVGDRWVEWNGRFRDDVRAFVRSDPGRVWAVSQRLIGSPDLYAHADREAQKTVNFVTCHDGFTLADLVSYDRKHNEANGEDNRDGTNDNLSWNWRRRGRDRRSRHQRAAPPPGEEPPDTEPARRRRADADHGRRGPAQPEREQQRLQPGQRAQLVRLVGRRARGRHAALHAALDRGAPARPGAARSAVDVTLEELLATARIDWHGVALDRPDRSYDSRSLAVTISGRSVALHIIANAYWEPLDFALPVPDEGAAWQRILDTTLASPDDIRFGEEAPAVEASAYRVGPRSVVVLAARSAVPQEAYP